MNWLTGISELLSHNYTLLVVTIGTGILCLASGVVGTFTFLRKRALIGDVISHAVLPGVAIAFMLNGVKDTFWFIVGAAIAGLLAVIIVDVVQKKSKLKPDTILALTLSVFFGGGIVLLTHIQGSGNAAQSGLDSFLFGKAASMNMVDIQLFALIAVLNITCIFIFLRGFTLLSFDEEYAQSMGFKTSGLKMLLSVITVLTVAIGVQAVGVVLMAALLITPAAGARFLTNNIPKMLIYSGSIGAISGIIGAAISSSGNGMPTGPWVVVSLSIIAFIAILFGPQKGLVSRMKLRNENKTKIDNENVLKAMYHRSGKGAHPVDVKQFQTLDEVHALHIPSILKRLKRKDLIEIIQGKAVFNEQGLLAAREVVRKHRLWELYLSKYFHLEADHLHDDAEGIEHVITPEIERHLTQLLEYPDKDPHESEIPY